MRSRSLRQMLTKAAVRSNRRSSSGALSEEFLPHNKGSALDCRTVPDVRVRACNQRPFRTDGEFVVYWMNAYRRTHANFALQRALEWSSRFQRPLLIVETLGCRARWSCDRFHQFVIAGMRDNAARCREVGVAYHPYIEPSVAHGRGLIEHLARSAAVIVTDDFPCYFLPKMLAAVAPRLPVLLEAVDSNGLWPMRATDLVFPTAYAFRRFLQKNLTPHLTELPHYDPFRSRTLPPLDASLLDEFRLRWPAATEALLAGTPAALSSLPIDHSIGSASFEGGEVAARKTFRNFLTRRLPRYAEHRNDPEEEAASGLSPYLHFGHISIHEIFSALTKRDDWSPEKLALKSTGSRNGWWGTTVEVEAFLDEAVTWREIGFNMCSHRDDYDQYESLPEWAQKTLNDHASDPRPHIYTHEQLEASETHDPLWNAAQRQLVTEGRMHNYLRMLWGKKILQWSPAPRDALATLIDLNNKYAVDGRNPNSYSGICWTLGRYDRPWGPVRPIFGTIRYMTSENTAKKLPVKGYLQRYGPQGLF